MRHSACGSIPAQPTRQLLQRCTPSGQTAGGASAVPVVCRLCCRVPNSRQKHCTGGHRAALLQKHADTSRVGSARRHAVITSAQSAVSRSSKAFKQSRKTAGQRAQSPTQPQRGSGAGAEQPTRAGQYHAPSRPANGPGRKYNLTTGFPFPLGPLSERKTIRSEVRPLLFTVHRGMTEQCSPALPCSALPLMGFVNLTYVR